MINLRKTGPAKHLTVIRSLCALPLILIGTQHLIGTAPILPILEGARIPQAVFFSYLVPPLEVLAGLLLLIGYCARLGALVTLPTMGVAVYAHLVHDWAEEPTIVLPIAVFVGVLQVLWGGAGAFSTDLAATD